MKFSDLSLKWRKTVIGLMVSSICLLISFIVYVWSTIGSLLSVMIG